MAITIRNLAPLSAFDLELPALGMMRCRHLTADDFSQANKRLKAKDTCARNFVRWLLGEIVRRPNAETREGARIRKSDVGVAKNYLAALNNLAEQYLIFAEGQATRRIAIPSESRANRRSTDIVPGEPINTPAFRPTA